MPAGPPPDDASIPDDAELWRAVHPGSWVQDKNAGHRRLSSGAFDDSSDGTAMSVSIANPGIDVAAYLARFAPGCGLTSFTAGQARACGQAIVRDPDPVDPHHALVVGPKKGRNKKCFLEAARMLVDPQPAN